MQSELKPCPFCGGEAGKVFFLKGHTPASIGDTQHSETCPLAFSWSGFYRPTPEEAIAVWNARASDAEITRLTEAVRAAEEREEVLREALAWYGEKAAGCRRITREGDDARYALDRDRGERARQALAGASP